MQGWAFTLSKVATTWVLPLGFSLSCILVGLGLRARWPRLGLIGVLIGSTWLWLASVRPVADHLQGQIERALPNLAVEEMAPADAIVVLGGTTDYVLPPRRFPDLGRGSDRIAHGLRLYRAGLAPKMILSGGGAKEGPGAPSEAEIMADFLLAWGVPSEAMILEKASNNTHENCLQTVRLAKQLGLEEVWLVTSALHMRRAAATCATAGLRFGAAPTDFEAVDRPYGALDWLPDTEFLDRTSRTIRERIAFQVYRSRGWIDPTLDPLRATLR